MLPDWVSNPGPLTYESDALPIALHGLAPSKDGTTHKGKNLFISERSQTYLQKLISIIKIGSKTEMRELLRLHYLLLLLYVSQVHKLRLYRLFSFHKIFECNEQLKDLM